LVSGETRDPSLADTSCAARTYSPGGRVTVASIDMVASKTLERHAAPVLDPPWAAAYCPFNAEVDITITVNLRVRPERDG
jgi:hypothetical protein